MTDNNPKMQDVTTYSNKRSFSNIDSIIYEFKSLVLTLRRCREWRSCFRKLRSLGTPLAGKDASRVGGELICSVP